MVVILVGWAFYSTFGGYAEPKAGAAGARDLTGMTNPHAKRRLEPSSCSSWRIEGRRSAIALPQPRVNPTPESCGLDCRVACGCVFSNTKPGRDSVLKIGPGGHYGVGQNVEHLQPFGGFDRPRT